MQNLPDVPDQSGMFTTAQARLHGWTDWQLAAAVRRSDLVLVVRGVYVPAALLAELTPVEAHRLRVLAAQLGWGDGWHAARRTAAWLHGLPLIGKPPTVPQLVRDSQGSHAKGRDRHARLSPLPPEDSCVADGVAITTLARTVVDIARQEVFRNGLVVADAALRAGCSKEELDAVLRRQRRWPGVASARTVVGYADGRAESPGESVTRAAFVREGLPVPEPQVEIWRRGEFVARVDLLVREGMLVVESDGAVKFTGPNVLPALLDRHERIRDCGLEVLRTSWAETFKDTTRFGMRVRDRLSSPRSLAPGVALVSTSVPTLRAA